MNADRYTQASQQQTYIAGMRPIFDKKALFSDLTADYVIPPEPAPYSTVTIRFRTKRENVDRVFLVSGNREELMTLTERDSLFDYYSVDLPLDDQKFIYHFKIISGRIICYYNKQGVVKNPNPYYSFFLIPGFSTPDWAKGAVMYQIYTDRFCNGDPSNDTLTDEYTYIGEHTHHVDDWDRYPASMDVREFYGGDLQGVLNKMDYLQDLGVEVIYFNPLFVSPSNHGYDIQDYDNINPHLGKIVEDEGDLLAWDQKENRFASRYINRVTNPKNLEASNELFRQVVEEAHRRGMKVILDGVFNHCGSFNKWLDRERIYENAEGYAKGAYVDRESPYRDYFQFFKDEWPYNYNYDGWWGHDTLPKLNYENSRELYDYILYIGRKWVAAPYYCDGWRLDVAADLGHSPEFNHTFWKDFRKAVKEANPNAIILAEHYGSPEAWLQGDEWDTVMNYDAFMEPVTWFLTGMQKHSDDYREDLFGNADSFWGAMTHHGACFTESSLMISMNQLSNHDHSRFLTRTNHKVGRTNNLGPYAANENVNKAVMREAVLLQMTWPGAPTIYYGDEAGQCGFTDPDSRRTYPWGHEDHELINFHREMIRIHKENPEIKTGSLKYEGKDYQFIAYGRFNRNERSLILVNNANNPVTKTLHVTDLGVPKEAMLTELIRTDENGFSTEPKQYPVINGKLTITIPKTGAIVLKHRGLVPGDHDVNIGGQWNDFVKSFNKVTLDSE